MSNCKHPAGNYIFKVNNRNTRARCEICSELAIKPMASSGVFNINFQHSVSIVEFEQVHVC